MKALGYIRVSGKGQVDGDGPERQRQAIMRFCTVHPPLTMHDFRLENGVSGTIEAMDRPEFSKLIADIEFYEEPCCIVVERLDRLARDLMVQEILLAECRKRGIKVYAADQGDLVDQADACGDPTRKLMRQIMGALAEWEKSVIVNKLRAARERKRAAGERCEGAKPYGGNSQEQEVLARINLMRDGGLTWDVIAYRLNTTGFHTRQGGPFSSGAVRWLWKHRRGV